MNIVVTTPTGNIGSVVTDALLDAGEKPVLIARDPSKLKDAAARGAVVKQGSHADADFLIEATKGADALFVLTPTDMQVQDIRAHYRNFAAAAAMAARENAIPHVVHLSSVGAELESGNGPVAGLHAAEQVLDAAGIPNLTHLRPGYFMENTLAQVPAILQMGGMVSGFPTGKTFPMIATRDIGARAAKLLRESAASGRRVVELQGAADTGYDEAAAILSEVLGRDVKHVTVSDEQMLGAMTGMGMSEVLAAALVELTHAVADGKMHMHEKRSASNTTPTTYRDFAREVFKPAFEAAAKQGKAQA